MTFDTELDYGFLSSKPKVGDVLRSGRASRERYLTGDVSEREGCGVRTSYKFEEHESVGAEAKVQTRSTLPL